MKRGETTVERVVASIGPWLDQAGGVTISGGEPFDQSEALGCLLRAVRCRSQANILVFTGYSYEHVRPLLSDMTGMIDALVTDPYDASAPQTLALRGSDNQRLHCLTPLGTKTFSCYERVLRPDERSLDVMFDDANGTAWIAGIPKHTDMGKLRELLIAQGHSAFTTDDSSLTSKAER